MENLNEYYGLNYDEDSRLTKDKFHSIEFLTTCKYLDKVLTKNSLILDCCAGTGAYSFYLANKGHQVIAGDLIEHNVALIKEKQRSNSLLKGIYQGSILDLSSFEDDSFDAVLSMGAFYHLESYHDRQKSINECLRVLKKGGIFILSYINKHAVILNDCKNNSADICSILKYDNHPYKDIFYGSTPKEVISLTNSLNLNKLYNIATDGIGYILSSKINSSSDEEFEKWLQYHFSTCEDENLLGYSLHCLYIGYK